jgi:hypothetical protein
MLEAELVAHVGGKPSITERLIIDQAIKARLQLDALGDKLVAGNFTDHDRRVFGALLNALRLNLRELGLKPASSSRSLSLAEYLANGGMPDEKTTIAEPPKRKRGRPPGRSMLAKKSPIPGAS